jgi:hypothetical protein
MWSNDSKPIDNPFELLSDLSCGIYQARIVNGLHGSRRIDSRHFDLADSPFLNGHIARQHRADLVFEFEGFIGKLRIARTEYSVIVIRRCIATKCVDQDSRYGQSLRASTRRPWDNKSVLQLLMLDMSS